MSETNISTAETQKQAREPIGVRIIGGVDPKTLSEEAFNNSLEILFHGAARDFEFSQTFDYHSEEYLNENEGSATIGFGLYLTNKDEARNYSHVRGGDTEVQVIKKFLPYQAKVLDLRDKIDPLVNAAVPKELAEKWRTRFLEYQQSKMPREDNIGKIFDLSESEYAEYLKRVINLPSIDLRVLLETAPAPAIKSRNLPSPLWSELFSEFMLSEGYDGLVYNEGGEGKGGKGGASFVFYNLEKIGTYESWQKKAKQS